jgi:N-sulfoglucosamine sulfohydrolase
MNGKVAFSIWSALFHVLTGLSVVITLPNSRAADAAKPNILWLIGEDMGPEALSRSGTPQVWTPTLDKLANEGVYYSHAYLGMVCSVSRSSFMTGMYAVSIGAQNHRTRDKKPLPEGVRVLTDWLRDAGYFTANIVKLPPALGFKGSGKTDWNFTTASKPFDSANWEDLKSHQPFYAQINFHETHRKFNAPRKADPTRVVIPPYYPDDPITRQDWANYLDAATELDRKVSSVLQQLQKDGLADNTVVVFFGDNGAAMVRAKQFCYEEGFHVPLIIRWPGDFPAPKLFRPGSVDARFIDGIDLSPTMLAIAGEAKPVGMQGHVLLGDDADAARDYVFGTRDRCDETVMRIRSVRDAHYRYIHNFTPATPFLAPNNYKETQYPVWNLLKELHAKGELTPAQDFLCQSRMPDEELYNLETDPNEIHNLAQSAKPEDQARLQELRAVLDQWIVDVDDHGRVPESSSGLTEDGAGRKARPASRDQNRISR